MGLHLFKRAALASCLWATVAAATTPVALAPVADAAMQGDVAAVMQLIKNGANVNEAQGDGMTALHWAAKHGNMALTSVLLKAGGDVAATTRVGAHTPLHVAARNGHGPVVIALLKAGAKAAALTSENTSALHLAAMSGDVASINALIDAGAPVNAAEPGWGNTPLMVAAGTGRGEAVRALLKRGADTKPIGRVLDVMAAAALDRRAKSERNATLAKLREQQGASAIATWQPSPEQVAASIKAARVIDAKGADSAALAELEVANHEEAQRLAAQGGPGLDDDTPGYTDLIGKHGGLSALHLAVREGATDAVVALLDGGADINQVTGGDHTSPILMAAINGHYDLVMVLIGRGANPNLASENGNTPLYGVINKEWAPSTRTPQPAFQLQQHATYVQVVDALLKAGANPNARLKTNAWYHTYNRDNLRVDFAGATPFFRAAYATDIPVMKLLLAAGADKNIPTIRPAPRARRGGGPGGEGGGAAGKADPSGLAPVPPGGPGVMPIHAATGVGYGQGFAGNDHRHVPDGWLPTVKYLVEELGADVNARDFAGYTPLHNAAARGDNEMIKYLVSKGADVTAIARNGMTTADMANGPVQRISPYLDTVKLLMDLGSKNTNRCVSC